MPHLAEHHVIILTAERHPVTQTLLKDGHQNISKSNSLEKKPKHTQTREVNSTGNEDNLRMEGNDSNLYKKDVLEKKTVIRNQ